MGAHVNLPQDSDLLKTARECATRASEAHDDVTGATTAIFDALLSVKDAAAKSIALVEQQRDDWKNKTDLALTQRNRANALIDSIMEAVDSAGIGERAGEWDVLDGSIKQIITERINALVDAAKWAIAYREVEQRAKTAEATVQLLREAIAPKEQPPASVRLAPLLKNALGIVEDLSFAEIVAILRGIADIEAGRTTPLEQIDFDVRLKAKE